MSDGNFIKIDSGLFVPVPKDQKQYVEMVTCGVGWNTNLKFDIDDVDEGYEWLEEVLGSTDKWVSHVNPIFGTKVIVSRELLAHVQSIGLAWADLDEIKAAQEQQRLLKIQRGRRSGGNHR